MSRNKSVSTIHSLRILFVLQIATLICITSAANVYKYGKYSFKRGEEIGSNVNVDEEQESIGSLNLQPAMPTNNQEDRQSVLNSEFNSEGASNENFIAGQQNNEYTDDEPVAHYAKDTGEELTNNGLTGEFAVSQGKAPLQPATDQDEYYETRQNQEEQFVNTQNQAESQSQEQQFVDTQNQEQQFVNAKDQAESQSQEQQFVNTQNQAELQSQEQQFVDTQNHAGPQFANDRSSLESQSPIYQQQPINSVDQGVEKDQSQYKYDVAGGSVGNIGVGAVQVVENANQQSPIVNINRDPSPTPGTSDDNSVEVNSQQQAQAVINPQYKNGYLSGTIEKNPSQQQYNESQAESGTDGHQPGASDFAENASQQPAAQQEQNDSASWNSTASQLPIQNSNMVTGETKNDTTNGNEAQSSIGTTGWDTVSNVNDQQTQKVSESDSQQSSGVKVTGNFQDEKQSIATSQNMVTTGGPTETAAAGGANTVIVEEIFPVVADVSKWGSTFETTTSGFTSSAGGNTRTDEFEEEEENRVKQPNREWDSNPFDVENVPKDVIVVDAASENAYEVDNEATNYLFIKLFATMCVVCVLGYVLFHNRNKLVALVVEGRKRANSTRKRASDPEYQKLARTEDNSEEVTGVAPKAYSNVVY